MGLDSEKFVYYWHRCIDMYNSNNKVIVVVVTTRWVFMTFAAVVQILHLIFYIYKWGLLFHSVVEKLWHPMYFKIRELGLNQLTVAYCPKFWDSVAVPLVHRGPWQRIALRSKMISSIPSVPCSTAPYQSSSGIHVLVQPCFQVVNSTSCFDPSKLIHLWSSLLCVDMLYESLQPSYNKKEWKRGLYTGIHGRYQ